MSTEPWVDDRVNASMSILRDLLAARELPFDEKLRSELPEQHGIYVISVVNARAGEFLRAGRTKTAGKGLRQRVYQNHFMGDQSGNLRAQLVRNGICNDLNETKDWMRRNCRVRFVIVEDEQTRIWAEHFMLSVLRPKYCD